MKEYSFLYENGIVDYVKEIGSKKRLPMFSISKPSAQGVTVRTSPI